MPPRRFGVRTLRGVAEVPWNFVYSRVALHSLTDGPDPHPRRAHAQSQEPERRFAEKPADRDHGAVGLRKILARLRHPLRGRTAPLRRVAFGLRAPVPATDGEARRRSDRGPLARDLDRA